MMLSRAVMIGALLLLATGADAPAQPVQEYEGYRIQGSQVQVEGRGHWAAWETAEGTRVIEAGQVRPRFLRRDIDAVLDASQFVNVAGADTTTGGISALGNPADTLTAPLAIDGDLATWWEPDATGDLERAWMEVDLGRVVIARRIVVRFAPAGQGDPFLKFRVLVSDGSRTFGSSRLREFSRAGQVTWRNKEQREFAFDVAPLRAVAEGVEGEPIQYVRVDLLDSDGLHAEEAAPARYALLASEDQGAVDYFRLTTTGREIPVTAESYGELPAAERGPVRYFRRERPRLAELEVQALGDEVVSLTQRAMFAEGDFFADLARRFTTDGLLVTSFPLRVYDPFRDKEQLRVDLGARFWIERVRLLSNKNALSSYQIRLSDGSLDANGQFLWYTLDERLNIERYLQAEEQFPLREVRLIELRRLDLLQEGTRSEELSELQAYGEGYVSDLALTSPLIKLGQRRMFARVRWEGDTPPGASLEIRTRSGDEILQIPHYFNRTGNEISVGMWERIAEQERGPVRIEEQPGPDWSSWSEPYRTSGEAFKSPTPRRTSLVQVRLRSTEPLRCATVRRLTLDFDRPLIDQAWAEMWPVRKVQPGVDQEFRLYLHLQPQAGDPGFDRLLLASSSSAAVDLQQVRQGTEDELRFDQVAVLGPDQVQPSSRPDGGLELRFAAAQGLQEQLLELRFATRLFLPSTTFRVEMWRQTRPEQVQSADPGDATRLVDSRSLVVVSQLGQGPLLGRVEVAPRVFTPNGDGINDRVTVRVPVFQVEGEHRVSVEVMDLSGRRVRDLSVVRAQPSGEHGFEWDGRDESGQAVPPGVYLVRVGLPTDAGAAGTQAVRVIHLAY